MALTLALTHTLGKPFAVLPCCVFANAFPSRRVQGGLVRTHAQLVAYLRAKEPSRIRVATLPFGGRNTVGDSLPGETLADPHPHPSRDPDPGRLTLSMSR